VTKQTRKQGALTLTPLSDGFAVVAIAEQCGDQAGEQKRQVVTQAMTRTGIRKMGKRLGKAQERTIVAQLLTLLGSQRRKRLGKCGTIHNRGSLMLG
jgi:hypothetical protein